MREQIRLEIQYAKNKNAAFRSYFTTWQVYFSPITSWPFAKLWELAAVFWLLDSQLSRPAELTRSPSSALSDPGSLTTHHLPSLRTVHLTVWPVSGMGQPCCSSVPSLSCVRLFATPWPAARQASLSITNSWRLLKLMSIESVMPSNHLILCGPLLLLPSIFPSIRVFSNESALRIRWPKHQ